MVLPKVIIESHIPFVPDGFMDGIADIRLLAPEDMTKEAVRDAVALIVRTRTRCDSALLDGSAVKLVATATIGTDHIDIPWCEGHGIKVVSAPGCNAPAVAQYVWSSVMTVMPDSWRDATIGVVGVGHVGAIVADWGRRLGVKVLACDPPRQLRDGGWNRQAPDLAGDEPFVGLDEIARQADVITFHTPHVKEGDFPTHHMGGEAFFDSLERCPLIVNAARGPIIDTEAILSAFGARKLRGSAVDCWEGEPALNRELLALSSIATPHIAGYSVEGKQRATHAVLRALVDMLVEEGMADNATEAYIQVPSAPPAVPSGCEITPEAILASYNPMADTDALKAGFSPEKFELMRNSYALRHEVGF